MAKCDTLLLDRTFVSAPLSFTQLFIIRGQKNHTYVPSAYCLLPNKEMESYQRVLLKIIAFLSPTFTLRRVCTDFEQAFHTVVKSVWSATSIDGFSFSVGARLVQENSIFWFDEIVKVEGLSRLISTLFLRSLICWKRKSWRILHVKRVSRKFSPQYLTYAI